MTEQRSSRLGPAIDRRIRAWSSEHVAERLWAKDGSLWAGSGVSAPDLAAWLGWLDLPDAMRERVPELRHLAEEVEHAFEPVSLQTVVEEAYKAAVKNQGGQTSRFHFDAAPAPSTSSTPPSVTIGKH